MTTVALVEQSVLSYPAVTSPEVAAFAAQFLALAPLIAAIILVIAALSAGARRMPAAEIVSRRPRGRKLGG